MANEDVINKVLQFFSSISDRTRLGILLSLTEKNKTVNEIYGDVGSHITLSAVSHQLKLLDNMKVISYEKKGRERYYKLSEDFCWCILEDAFKHFNGKCKCAKMKHFGVK